MYPSAAATSRTERPPIADTRITIVIRPLLQVCAIDKKGSSGENCTLKFIIAMNICGGFAPGDERAESLLQRWELAH